MSEKLQITQKIAEALKSRPIISFTYLQKIFQGFSKKQIIPIFFSFAQNYPEQVLFSFQLRTKHSNNPQNIEEDGDAQYLNAITIGYANYNEIIALKRQADQSEHKCVLQKVLPQAIFDPQLQRNDVIQTVRKPRPQRNFKLIPKQYISIVRQDAKKYDEEKSKKDKMPKDIKTQEKLQNDTKKKQKKQKKTLKIVNDLPRLNSKEGEKVKSSLFNRKMEINSESEEEQNKEIMKTSEKVIAPQVEVETDKLARMQIQEDEDEEAQFIKFMNNKQKPENISTNLPVKSVKGSEQNKKKMDVQENAKKVVQKNKSVVVGNNQKTLFAFMNKK